MVFARAQYKRITEEISFHRSQRCDDIVGIGIRDWTCRRSAGRAGCRGSVDLASPGDHRRLTDASLYTPTRLGN